jgi:hypothetical protein
MVKELFQSIMFLIWSQGLHALIHLKKNNVLLNFHLGKETFVDFLKANLFQFFTLSNTNVEFFLPIIGLGLQQSSKWINWYESNSWIYFYIVLNKNLPVQTKFYWSWARELVLIMTVTRIFYTMGTYMKKYIVKVK